MLYSIQRRGQRAVLISNTAPLPLPSPPRLKTLKLQYDTLLEEHEASESEIKELKAQVAKLTSGEAGDARRLTQATARRRHGGGS